jgi:Cdc6-like AAA superfamily ATPase
MGIVYEALDRERNTRVALKTLKDWTGESLLRFKNEFRALQDLQHRNLVKLGELIEESGQWFFTMELVSGSDFIGWVRPMTQPNEDDIETGAFDAPRSAHAPRYDEQRLRSGLLQLVHGLTVLHAAGKVHRDVKPSNIMVTPDGRIVLLDFGLAVSSEPDAMATQSSKVLGTAPYMAPEQAAGIPVGPEADWYSVGVILYQALTGTLPFDGPAVEVLMAKQREEPVPPRARVPTVPADLNALCVELLRISPAARPSGQELLRRLDHNAVADASSQPSFLQAPDFVGREAELAQLDEAFAAVRKRGATAICIQGDSGVGKSALARRFIERLTVKEAGLVVLAGRCYERESVPYKAFDGLVDSLARQMNRMARPDAIVPRLASLLAQAFPVLLRVEAIAQAPKLEHDIREPQELRSRVFGAMRELLTRLGDRQPLLLVIDDLQWADADSLALLKEILRPPDAPAVLLVATLRTDEGAISGSLPADARRVRLAPLPPADACELASQLIERFQAKGSVTPEAIAAEAGGHPLFIDELVRHVRERDPQAGPLRLDEALSARIARLDAQARQILEVLAVAGTPLTQTTAARAARSDIGSFTTRLIELRSANLLRTGGTRLNDTVELYHDRVRESVLVHIEPSARREWHERLAVAIETSERPDPEAIAIHWQAAGNGPRAATFAVKAAERATDALAFDRAARLYAVALELRPSEGNESRALRVKLAESLANAGRGKEAATAYLASLEGATAAEVLDLRRRAATQLLTTGHIEEGLETMQSVLAAVGLEYPATPRKALMQVIWRRMMLRLRGLRFKRRDESSVSSRELARIDVCYHAGLTLAIADHIRGHAFHVKGLSLALRAGEPFRVARALGLEIGYQSTPGGANAARVEAMAEVTEALSNELDHPQIRAFLYGVMGQVHYLAGRFSNGAELVDKGERMLRERCVGMPWEINTCRLWRARCLFYLGRLQDLSRQLPADITDCRQRGDLYGDTSLRCSVYPFLVLAEDDPVRAKEEIALAMKLWSPRGFHIQHYYARFAEACADIYAGNSERALDIAERTWRDCKGVLLLRIQLVRVALLDLRARAAIARAAQDTAQRKVLLGRAAKDARRIAGEKMPYTDPMAWLLNAGIASLRGDPETAITKLRLAVDGFEKAELALHAAAARRRLGQLVGGPEGEELVSAANTWMTRQGIMNPTAMTALYAPGFPS